MASQSDGFTLEKNVIRDELSHLKLKGVNLTDYVLGQGSFGIVYKAEHNGATYAAKQLQVDLKSPLAERIQRNFMLECLQHCKLHHPNIVKALGVFYSTRQAILPVLVMELMECNLTKLLEKTHNILMYIKLSILQDVSGGLCYLHAQKPPIVHQALYSDNILLTKGLIAKIGDFKTGEETVSGRALLSVQQKRDINGFLPDPVRILEYDVPLNVFSFGCVVCHVITQIWPVPQSQPHIVITKIEISTSNLLTEDLELEFCPLIYHRSDTRYTSHFCERTSNTVDDWSIEKHQNYINLINDNSLKQLIEACLQKNYQNRPSMSLIYDRITGMITGELNKIYEI